MNCDSKTMRLYAVTDRAWTGRQTLYEQVEDALRGGATCVQLREKTLGREAFLREAVEIGALCCRYGVPFLINDDVGIALESGADGVHVGQEDLAAREARRLLGPDKIVGVSAHTVEEAVKAERDGADYLGVGAVFHTDTKTDVSAMPLDTLRAIRAAVRIPIVAIGGISLANVERLAGSGVDGIAVVSALFAAENVREAAERLRAASERMVAMPARSD